MNKISSRLATTLLALVAGAGAVMAVDEVPIVPMDTGSSVKELLYARPFTLDAPYAYVYTKEQAPMTSGYVLVVDVDKRLAQAKDVDSPVLYVGNRPAEVTNFGVTSGHLVVLVPGDTDLASSPIFFGSVELPERVDRARGDAEVSAALAVGVRPVGTQAVTSALLRGGQPLHAHSIDDVYRSLADVLTTYAPDETERIETYRMIPASR